jgi:hypothetical protein
MMVFCGGPLILCHHLRGWKWSDLVFLLYVYGFCDFVCGVSLIS